MTSYHSPRRGIPVFLILLAFSCSRQPVPDGFTGEDFPPLLTGEDPAFRQAETSDSPLQLKIAAPSSYLPGQAVVFEVELANLGGDTKRLLSLDHKSLAFYMFPATEEGRKHVRKIDPVYSESEPTGLMTPLRPGESLKRRFLFTQLTFDRGKFILMAECTPPGRNVTDIPPEGESPTKRSKKDKPGDSAPQKIYSAPFEYSVQGDKVAAHRYLNGLLARKDAIELAKGEVDGEVAETDAIRILDEMGFEKYWVNVQYRDKAGKESTRSFFIDPYLARVWKEAKQPFGKGMASGEMPFPKDSKVYKELREKKFGQKVP